MHRTLGATRAPERSSLRPGGGTGQVATVSVPSSSLIATSIE